MYLTHLLRQGPVVGGMLRLAAAGRGEGAPETPGPEFTETVPPRPRSMVRDYLRFVGGDPGAWRGQLPPHLFPQWGFPLYTRALAGLPYDLKKVVNAGFRYTAHGPLPDDEPLELSSRLMSVDDDGRRALIELELVTGTASSPRALVATNVVFVPTGRRGGEEKKAPRPKPTVPLDARTLGSRRLGRWAGWDFAQLTGDVNPLHWLTPYARASGFKRVILHGFCTAAVCIEAINRGMFAGDVSRLRSFEARFTRPQLLPGTLKSFVRGGEAWVGESPGGPATLTGAFEHA